MRMFFRVISLKCSFQISMGVFQNYLQIHQFPTLNSMISRIGIWPPF